MSILNKHIDIKFTTKEDWLPHIQQLFPYEIDMEKFEVKNGVLTLYNPHTYGMKIIIDSEVLDILDKTDINILKFETNRIIEELYYEVVVCIKKACLNKFKKQLTLKYNNQEKVRFEII